jgi:response regulator RpfG family c-di-GMP phosphodiesterase
MNELIRKRARYLLADTLHEPVLFFDKKNLLADFNKEAAEKFGLSVDKLNAMTREYFETSILQLTYEEDPNPNINREVVLQKEYAEIWYHFTVQKIQSTRKGFLGRVYSFQDISKQKMMYNALEKSSVYDQLTGFYTDRVFANKMAELNKLPEEYIVAICNIADLKLVNAFYDRSVCNSIIQKMSEELRNILPEDTLVCYAAEGCAVIVAQGITEEQMSLYLSTVARKVRKRALDNVPVFLNFGIARRENTAVSIEEYIKYAEMDLLIKKGKEGSSQKREMTIALTEEYFRNEYESLDHVKRIQALSEGFADHLKLSVKETEKLLLLCTYHDIGRVKTREEVWSRAAVITRDELDVVKLHSITGYQIISRVVLSQNIADLILYHHENFDGSGYPYGVSGEEIPLLARILAIIDSYDVMINDQLYKGAVTEELALEELRKNAGTQFDPVLVDAFEAYLKERK